MSVTIKETLNVKPSKPTKHVQIPLSNCDIQMPPIYSGFIYFFKNGLKKDNFMNIKKLLASLEDVLNDFYPLAGTIKRESDGRSFIDCNNRGVQFIIAECSDITIDQLEKKNWEHAVIPYALLPSSIPNKINPALFVTQHTTLADGSVAFGFSIHHQIADGFGLFTFIENWGRRARLEQIDPPIHDRSLLKASGNPPTHVPYEYFIMKPGSENISNVQQSSAIPSLTAKIYRFSQDALKSIHDYYSVGISTENWISTNDALVAHIWRTTTRARNIDLNTEVLCGFALDGRDKLNPPIPKSYYGNVTFPASQKMLVSQLINDSPSSIALQIRKVVTDMNNSRIRSTIDWIEQQPDKSLIKQNFLFNGKDFAITNWSKFQVHNLIDFGDGAPIKQRSKREIEKFGRDGISLILGAENGVEIYICLQTEKLENLEHDPEFKKFIVP